MISITGFNEGISRNGKYTTTNKMSENGPEKTLTITVVDMAYGDLKHTLHHKYKLEYNSKVFEPLSADELWRKVSEIDMGRHES